MIIIHQESEFVTTLVITIMLINVDHQEQLMVNPQVR